MASVDNSAWDGPAAMAACKSASDFRSICAGERNAGTPDERQHWALPHHKRPGAGPNAAGVRNALGRLPGTQGLMNKQAAQAHLEAHMHAINPDYSANSAPADGEFRTVPFELGGVEANGDGLTFEGYAAVFNTPTRIAGWDEDFDEQIAPTAFDRTLAAGFPKLMFEHGRHPLIGTMPLGVLTRAAPDSTGLWISGRLTDNWLIQPVRDAVRDKAIDGMSFRFTVDEDGETWLDRAGDVALRTLLSLGCPELGPVVFPAYEPTTASVRSAFDKLPEFGRPPAGARAANGRAGDAPGNRAEPNPPLSDRFRRDSEALLLRGIEGVRI